MIGRPADPANSNADARASVDVVSWLACREDLTDLAWGTSRRIEAFTALDQMDQVDLEGVELFEKLSDMVEFGGEKFGDMGAGRLSDVVYRARLADAALQRLHEPLAT